jgi:nucleotide-binding universal stress UspA family protein
MKVLVAIDDSPYSDAAIESVGNRPWPDHTEFRILSVLEMGSPEYGGWEPTVIPSMEPIREQIRKDREEFMNSRVARLKELLPGRQIAGKVIEGYVREAIIRESTDWEADFLIMGSHGRRGLKRFLLGSVAEGVLAHAPCTVEIVKIPHSVHDEEEENAASSAG